MLVLLITGLLAMESIERSQNLMSGHKDPVPVCQITCRPFMRHSIPKSHESNPDSTVTFIIVSLNLGPWWNYWPICLRWKESQLNLALYTKMGTWYEAWKDILEQVHHFSPCRHGLMQLIVHHVNFTKAKLSTTHHDWDPTCDGCKFFFWGSLSDPHQIF